MDVLRELLGLAGAVNDGYLYIIIIVVLRGVRLEFKAEVALSVEFELALFYGVAPAADCCFDVGSCERMPAVCFDGAGDAGGLATVDRLLDAVESQCEGRQHEVVYPDALGSEVFTVRFYADFVVAVPLATGEEEAAVGRAEFAGG